MNAGIGKRLKELSKSKGMTLKEVGDIVGVTATAISCYESETRKAPVSIIKELTVLYGTTSDYIISGKRQSLELKELLEQTHLYMNGVPINEDMTNLLKQFCEVLTTPRKRA